MISPTDDLQRANQFSHDAWNENALFWDERMGEGNDFVELLTWPAILKLLNVTPAKQILDIACGNGLTSRRLAGLGARVVAFDFAEKMIEQARHYQGTNVDHITYHVLDASDEAALLGLGERSFDAALCNMALFDMATIDPLLRALSRLFKPEGHFVFSVIHPCFNNSRSAQMAELVDSEGKMTPVYSVKVSGYLTPTIAAGEAIAGQPRLQPYFHRPLHFLFGKAFQAGFVLDGLEEPSFPPDHPSGSNPLSWSGKFSEIPPVLVARLCLRS
jgi:2-polyprenyl-3-methyl-5-hydroxy-6-metoxy-1,4-benzoquinol methylase